MLNDLFAPLIKQRIKNGEWWIGDCLELMKDIPNGSVDMVLCDLPYGTTACKWDTVIPFEPLWREYHRIAKERAAIVLTASQPFTSALVMSNVDNFAHEWIWNKRFAGNFVQAKRQPMKDHENVLVFGLNGKQPQYFPIMKKREKPIKKGGNKQSKAIPVAITKNSKNFGNPVYNEKHPTSVTSLDFSSRDKSRGLHPTQKPVALFEYLIKTYTKEDDLILDNTAGSGTTAVAAENTNRRWICIERDPEYSRKACERIRSCV